MNNMSTTGIVAAIAAVVLVGVGVWAFMMNGDSDDTANTTETSQTTKDDEKMSESSSDIVATAVATPSLSTLVTAVQAADLAETLQGEGPFTVFAPTNAAFEKLPEGTLDTLLKPENKADLSNILTYHVVSGSVMAADLSDGQKVKTLQGDELTVDIMDDKVYLVDAKGGKAMVTTADVEASNGVVHIIDAVLMPSDK